MIRTLERERATAAAAPLGATADACSGRAVPELVRGMRVAFAGGGTGGHVVPGKHLLAHAAGALGDVLWFCTGRAVEEPAFASLEGHVPLVRRVALGLEPDGGGAPSLSGLALRTGPAVTRARHALRAASSEVVVGLGGFTSLPAVLAARSLKIPVALLEINATRGRATRWLASLSAKVLHAWPATLPRGASARDAWTGPPLAPGFARGAPTRDERVRARSELGFDPARPLLVVLGGSQGAKALNRFVAMHAVELVRHGVQILHQTGPGRLAEASASLPGLRSVEFVADVRLALAAATIVLCRGGASTLAEVAAMRRPAWVVPYPHHRDRHQERNARELGAGARVVDEARLDGAFARELVQACGPAAEVELERRSRELERALPLDAAERIWIEIAALAQRARGERS